jgi:hypothetical protein
MGFLTRLFGVKEVQNLTNKNSIKVKSEKKSAKEINIDLLLKDDAIALRKEVAQSLPIVSIDDPSLSVRLLNWESDTYVIPKEDGSVVNSWETAFEDLMNFLQRKMFSTGSVSITATADDRLRIKVRLTQRDNSWVLYSYSIIRLAENEYLCFWFSSR